MSGLAAPSIALGAVVVTYRSEAVVGSCLAALRTASEHHPIHVVVVDNASPDASADHAASAPGVTRVVRLGRNRGFAAGVNAGLAALGLFGDGPEVAAVAVVNPDTRFCPGSLDRLAEILEQAPRAGLVAPRVFDEGGRFERSVGHLPSLARERRHALMLDRFSLDGRTVAFPDQTAPVEWASGCAWLLRAEAVRMVGPLDEAYFMYFEDVDYCRRLRDSGWEVLATPEAHVIHAIGRGSSGTPQVPADGGPAILHYFEKFHSAQEAHRVRRWLMLGWRLRLMYRGLRAALGDRRSGELAHRYRLALATMRTAR